MRCSCHPIFESIPPHEHGMYSVKFRIATIYAVNKTIVENAARSPMVLNFGISNKTLIVISITGINQTINPEKAVSKGD
jgi:hypothetical protein